MSGESGFHRILVVDLLGGIGDLVMVLPAVHALARHHRGAALRVLTHAPGDTLLRFDPAVSEVHRVDKGREREGVVDELHQWRPDLVVSTTRYGGIPEEIECRGVRSVTDLWRKPPPDELVSRRYVRILAAEGLVDPAYRPPKIHLTAAERAAGERVLADHAGHRAPVVLVPNAGMTVKFWPHTTALVGELTRRDVPVLVVGERTPTLNWAATYALAPTDLRGLAGLLAAVGGRGGAVVGPDTGPMRVAAAVGAPTISLFGPTAAARYGLDPPAVDLQGLPGCPHRRPTSIAEQVCWWDAVCPLSDAGPACMADIDPTAVLTRVLDVLGTADPDGPLRTNAVGHPGTHASSP